ncbi:MAG: DUF4080 domain-containing protein [Pseudomonadota bacterium]
MIATLGIQPKKIVLATLNAKFVHASLGLRYLYANMGNLKADTIMHEYSINARVADIAESLVSYQPSIIGLGIYIWNVNESLALIRLLRQILDNVVIILGGPEVSYETEQQEIVSYADYVLCGQADLAFAGLVEQLLKHSPPLTKIMNAQVDCLDELESPYSFYTEEDILHRIIYLEASRGCPFKCEFCLSALDKTSIPFNLDSFLLQLDNLFERGARQFKFVDRTFNLKIASSQKILNFFLNKLKNYPELDKQLFVHFEIIPDRLPEQLKQLIVQFPQGCLQFEIGIQTFNHEVQQLISRKQDTEKTLDNLSWLRKNTHAYLHADLIIGLPGESWQSFARSFNQLVGLKPHDIQLGILKRLKGTPVIRHTSIYQLNFNHQAPYDILSTNCLSYQQIRELGRFARYWEIISNCGIFNHTLEFILGKNPFNNFYHFSQWLYQYSSNTHRFSQRRLFDLLYSGGQHLGIEAKILWDSLWLDYQQSGLKGKPAFMQESK